MNKPYELNGFFQAAVHKYSQTIVKVAFSYLKNTADAEVTNSYKIAIKV